MDGCQNKSVSEALRAQCGEDAVGRRNNRSCVQSDLRVFGIAGDWKTTALEVGLWVGTVTEGGRRFIVEW